ncbi:uncharacterized protein N7443_002891 [Penicillium atrosanguineum]|uniref:uncharacterized protein n=1 Tax=Penicillium atrosanguineum TaxID=1132637 RepID=UPI0023945CD6|nr:uncharacterized protein N7443_002891 [Penicillium atrosanguineum]KAJ5310430.1 hypothetical protein N7443_002891 [Penicillium atrosanguineum]
MPCFLAPEQIQVLEETLNYTFKDKALLSRVFEAASSTSTPEGNKRLALLGRSLLGFLRNLKSVEQDLAVVDMNSHFLRNSAAKRLATLGFTKSLQQFIRVNPASSLTDHVSDKLMALSMEALLAAVFLDYQRDLTITCEFATGLRIL